MTLQSKKGTAADDFDDLDEFGAIEDLCSEFDSEVEDAEVLPPPPPKLADISSKNIESNVFVVNMAGKARVMRWGKSPLSHDARVRVPEFMATGDFKTLIANKSVIKIVTKTVEGEELKVKKPVPLFDHWFYHESRYTYDGVVCDATLPKFNPREKSDVINLWRGFGVAENSHASWKLMEDHIRENLANGDASCAEFILNWAAYAVQNPTEPCGVMLHFYSAGKGTGKTVFGMAMKNIFGPLHGTYVTQASHLVGKFNAHLAQTGLLFLDEAIFPGYKEHQNVLKTLITEENLMIEKKGIDTVPMRNALKIISASNEKWMVQASGDERRHAMFEVGEGKKQNRKYFGALSRQLYEDGGLGRMLYDLRRRDLKGWHPEAHIPTTALLMDNKRTSAPPEVRWFSDILDEGALPRDYIQSGLAPDKVQSAILYQHARRRPGLERTSDWDFAKFLEKWGTRKRERSGSVWHFPALTDVRKAWLKEYPYWGAFDPNVQAWFDEDAEDPAPDPHEFDQ